eukprot:SAG11_NODE_9199_length_931_cov_3.790168_1_plen_47_part_00
MNAAESALVEVAKYLDREEWYPAWGVGHDEVWEGVQLVQTIALTIS